MRADRLVATLLLLQSRGTVTAREVADELEISERTARRDLEALGVAGLPVYSQQGRGGGWRLLGGARTDLTGLASAEARALMTMAAATGRATPEFSAAVRKLSQALPEPMRDETRRAVDAVLSDDSHWGLGLGESILDEERRDHWLDPLQRAIVAGRRVELTYDTPRKGRSVRWAEPLGLVSKRGTWYLLAATADGRRSFRVDRMAHVDLLDETFDAPTDFDLGAAWDEVTADYTERTGRMSCLARVEPWVVDALRGLGVTARLVDGAADRDGIDARRRVADSRDTPVGQLPVDVDPDSAVGATTGAHDRLVVEIAASGPEVLATQVAGLVGPLELVDPPAELVELLARAGRRLVERFTERDAVSPPDRSAPRSTGRSDQGSGSLSPARH